jgi:CubicO group peptidase (beta-lactamase class C family)
MNRLSRITFGFLLLVQVSFAQTDYAGSWQGTVELPGRALDISIHLQKEGSQWKGFLTIPAQQIKDMVLAELVIEGRNIRFKLPEVPAGASYSGVFDEKSVRLDGKLTQAGQQFPMNLTRTSAVEKAAEEKRLTDAITAFRHLIDSLREKRHTPGLAFGLIKDGKILINEGFGYRDLEKKIPVTANTLFAIGSSSKAFTTAGLAILADRGALDWEKPVVQYMPDFKLFDDFSTREINATDLTCHRSGLPRHDLIWYGAATTRQQIFDRLRYLKPNKSLRTTWQYNNLMFMTAGCLIEHISGKSWEAFTQEAIFRPLGMNSTNFSVNEMLKSKDAALGYLTKDKQNTRLDYRNLDAIGPAGSINSTTTDMLQWVKLHLNKGSINGSSVISSSEITHLHSPQMLMDNAGLASSPELKDLSYALGWMTYRHRGLKVVEHGGNIDGFSALVYLVPEKDFGLVILTNQNAAGVTSVLARYATDMILGLETTDWYARTYRDDDQEDEASAEDKKPEPRRIANTSISHPEQDYVGEYEHPGYGRAEIKKNAESLSLHFNSFNLPLEHWHYDVFRARDTTLGVSLMINFHSDANGVIHQLSTNLDPQLEDESFTKAPPARLSDPEFLKKLTGKYTIGTGENSCRFELRHTTLYAKLPGQPEYTLVPFQGTEFKLKGLNGYSVEFVLDEKGIGAYANFVQPEGVFKAKKAE